MFQNFRIKYHLYLAKMYITSDELKNKHPKLYRFMYKRWQLHAKKANNMLMAKINNRLAS